MKLSFYKYQATGNDFVILDGLKDDIDLKKQQVARVCHRRFGVGADGLMIIAPSDDYDFKMVYFNSDGRLSTMCGNGGRAISHLAHSLGYMPAEGTFEAVDGPHKVRIEENLVHLKMIDVSQISSYEGDFIVNTGSPHYVQYVDNLDSLDVIKRAHKIRYNERFKEEGINVNFIEEAGDILIMRTYERGVEDETYSCGTGVTAAALVSNYQSSKGDNIYKHIKTKGGNLEIRAKESKNGYHDIWLSGPAVRVFVGEYYL